MSSSKLILIFLGFIFLAIILLSSNKIATSLRGRFGKIFPTLNVASKITPTPTPTIALKTPTPTKLPTTVTNQTGRFSGGEKGSPTSEIPATGPAEVMWLILGGSAAAGVVLTKISHRSTLK